MSLQTPLPTHKSPESILIVDDHPDMREYMRKIVESRIQFSHVIEAEDGADAIQKLESHPEIRLVISDHQMPSKQGVDVMDFIFRTHRSAHFVLCSSDLQQANDDFKARLPDVRPYASIDKDRMRVDLPRVLDEIARQLIASDAANSLSEEEGYIAIHIQTLQKLQSIPVDVFIIPDQEIMSSSPIRTVEAGDFFTAETFQHFSHRGIKKLAIRQADAQRFFQPLVILKLGLQAWKDLSEAKSSNRQAEILESVACLELREDLKNFFSAIE